jgi:hypothetical protein
MVRRSCAAPTRMECPLEPLMSSNSRPADIAEDLIRRFDRSGAEIPVDRLAVVDGAEESKDRGAAPIHPRRDEIRGRA